LRPEVRGLNFGPKNWKKICAIICTQFDTEVFFWIFLKYLGKSY
jgi:hypothetical protein